VLIIGAGPAGLFAAEYLSAKGLTVTVIDRMPSPARKFLMAGRGGLNITHSEPLDAFASRYRDAERFLHPMVTDYSPADMVKWCEGLGEETFVGTSGRVFPKSMKASPLLRAWLRRLTSQGVTLEMRRSFVGFSEDGHALVAQDGGAPVPVPARATLLALGGASWPKLGSNAAWVPVLRAKGVQVRNFQPANCGFLVSWSDHVQTRFAGTPLKRIHITCGLYSVPGEAVLSAKGLEGGAVYALSAEIRDMIARDGAATLSIDLRPEVPLDALAGKLRKPRGKQSISTFLKKAAGLHPAEQALLREAGPLPADPEDLARRIKAVPVTCLAPYGIDRAISSSGGIALGELNDRLMIRKLPGIFAAGEMLDWEAPTGGYLLQACFATGRTAAEGIHEFLTAQEQTGSSQ